MKILREESHITSAEFGTEFCAECPKASAVAENFNRVFTSSVASACAAQKTNQLRRAVADSFGAKMCIRDSNQNGLIYTPDNIDALLNSRYETKKIRMAGGRIKGPQKRRPEQNEEFEKAIEKMIEG